MKSKKDRFEKNECVAESTGSHDHVHKTQNHLKAVDAEGRLHAILVESTRHVTRTWRGPIVQTGVNRFFLASTQEPLVLNSETAKLHTEDGLQEFTLKID